VAFPGAGCNEVHYDPNQPISLKHAKNAIADSWAARAPRSDFRGFQHLTPYPPLVDGLDFGENLVNTVAAARVAEKYRSQFGTTPFLTKLRSRILAA